MHAEVADDRDRIRPSMKAPSTRSDASRRASQASQSPSLDSEALRKKSGSVGRSVTDPGRTQTSIEAACTEILWYSASAARSFVKPTSLSGYFWLELLGLDLAAAANPSGPRIYRGQGVRGPVRVRTDHDHVHHPFDWLGSTKRISGGQPSLGANATLL